MTDVGRCPTDPGCQPAASAAEEASSRSGIRNARWQRGPFKTRVRGELGPEWLAVSGYTNGVFGLDRRRYLDDETPILKFGYCVSHLLTGYAVRYVRGPLAQAKAFADEIGGRANWDFDDPVRAKSDPRRRMAVKAACELFNTSDGMGFDPPAPSDQSEQEGGHD